MNSIVARRFYRSAAVARHADGFAVELDGRMVRTPAGEALLLSTAGLAAAVADEWNAQPDELRPDTMPVMRLAATAIDRVGPRRSAVVDSALAYAGTDLLCYRVASPADLASLQRAAWQPLLDWARETFGAVLEVTDSIAPLAQPKAAITALRPPLEAMGDIELAAVLTAVDTTGSLVLGLALGSGRIDAEAAFAASQLDETYQMERWGEDEEAMERRRLLRSELDVVERVLALVRDV